MRAGDAIIARSNVPKSDRSRSPVPWWEKVLWSLVAFTIVVTPLVITRDALDIFRTPKTVVFHTLALLILAFAGGAMLLSDRVLQSFRTDRAALILAVAAVAWTSIVSLTSLKPIVSLHKPLSLFCLAVFFLATIWATWNRGRWAVATVLVPAIVNAIVAIPQSFGKWVIFPIAKKYDQRLLTSALIGNVNEVGAYLLLPFLAAIAAAIAWKKMRPAFAVAVLVLGAGVVAAQSVTSMAAAVCGVGAMMFLPGARRLRWFGAGAAIVLIFAVSVHPGSRARLVRLLETARSGDLSQATSFRLPAYAVALRMFQERPLIGVGPGVYGAMYMGYKFRVDADHPEWIELGNQNFGEVHNDHLQILAESGVPGYLLFLTAIVLIARLSFSSESDPTERRRFVRAFALPAAVGFFVLTLGHFAMQVTSTALQAVTFAALCFAWKGGNESD